MPDHGEARVDVQPTDTARGIAHLNNVGLGPLVDGGQVRLVRTVHRVAIPDAVMGATPGELPARSVSLSTGDGQDRGNPHRGHKGRESGASQTWTLRRDSSPATVSPLADSDFGRGPKRSHIRCFAGASDPKPKLP